MNTKCHRDCPLSQLIRSAVRRSVIRNSCLESPWHPTVRLSVRPTVYEPTRQPVCPSDPFRPSVNQSARPSLSPPTRPPVHHLSNAPFHQNVYPSARPSKRGTFDLPACLPARPSIRPAILLPVVRHSPPLVRTIRGYPGALSGVFHGYIMGVSYGYPMALSGLILGYPMGILGYPRVSYAIWLNQHFGSTIQS